jgi:hypothetical protein
MRCPHCKNKLIQRQGDTIRIRARTVEGPLLIKSDGFHGQCFWCKADVVIPMSLGVDVPAERFFLGTPPSPEKDLTPIPESSTFQKDSK